MSGSWPMIIVDVVWVVSLTLVCGWFAGRFGSGWGEVAIYVAVSGPTVLVLTALPLRHFLMVQRRTSATREAMLSEEGERRAFESQLVRALEMTSDQPTALDVAIRAVGLVAPETRVEILLADSSWAHLTRVAASPPEPLEPPGHPGHPGPPEPPGHPATGLQCQVETPRGCPAVRSGHAIRFDDGGALDACPHLRTRGEVAAVCAPVSVMGSTTGVVHLVRTRDRPFALRESTAVTGVAQQLGSRLGLVTAMTQSELQASTDPLTGLLNRRSLENRVRMLTAAGAPYALVLADLDHFKVLNDTHGHDAGDRALRVFARVLHTVVRDGDLVCRYGGEEFLIVMPNSTSEHAARVVDRIRLELLATFTDGRTPPFTVSAGVTDTGEGEDLVELVTLADRALLQAKRAGRNCTMTLPLMATNANDA